MVLKTFSFLDIRYCEVHFKTVATVRVLRLKAYPYTPTQSILKLIPALMALSIPSPSTPREFDNISRPGVGHFSAITGQPRIRSLSLVTWLANTEVIRLFVNNHCFQCQSENRILTLNYGSRFRILPKLHCGDLHRYSSSVRGICNIFFKIVTIVRQMPGGRRGLQLTAA